MSPSRNPHMTTTHARSGHDTALPGRLFRFYLDGFRSMVVGRTLWKIIILKLVVILVVLKFFLLPNYLEKNFASDAQRSEHVLDNLTRVPPR